MLKIIVISAFMLFLAVVQVDSGEPVDVRCRPVIVIDPGHPSETGRGCAHNGMTELQICWQMAQKLQALIEQSGEMTVVKTRDEMARLVTNRQRAELANNAVPQL
jgi:N-acetylmuramoyl-L-alanine amidase